MNYLLITILALIIGFAPAAKSQTLKLGMNENAVEQTVASKLLTEIYAKSGLKAEVTPLPATRSTQYSLHGDHDGEVARINGYFAKNPELVKVEPSYYYLTTAVFAKKGSGISVQVKADLKKYKVAIVSGVAHAEAAVADVPDVQKAPNYESLYKMLEAGRVDVVVDTGINGTVLIRKLKLDLVPAGELVRLDLYSVLTAKNKDLAPKLSATIKSLKDSGELSKMVLKAEQSM